MQILKDIVKRCELVEDEAITSFINFNSSSLDIKLIYYIKPDSNTFKAQSCINLEILKRFEQEGLEFAYPTQTLYMQKG